MRRLLVAVSLIAAGLALALGALELALRVSTWSDPNGADNFRRRAAPYELAYTSHPFVPFTGSPGTTMSVSWSGADGITYTGKAVSNAHGFRTHEFAYAKGPQDFVVVTLGGSTTWGAIAPTNADTWPGKLEALLQQAYPGLRIRVYNLAHQAANSGMSVVNLALHGVHLQPDLVITYHLINDGDANGSANFRTDYAHFYRDFSPETSWVGYHQALPDALRHSHLAVAVARGLDDALGNNELGGNIHLFPEREPDIDAAVVAARLLANLRTIDALARSRGAASLFATFQFYDPDDAGRGANAHLREAFEREEFDYVDIEAIMPDLDRSLQIDECHFTDRGREIVAESFFRHIVDASLVARQRMRRAEVPG